MWELFKHEDFRYGYEIVLGSAYRGYSDVGEVLATAGRIKDGDGDAWVREWCATAERLEGDTQAAEGLATGSAPAACTCGRRTTSRPGCT